MECFLRATGGVLRGGSHMWMVGRNAIQRFVVPSMVEGERDLSGGGMVEGDRYLYMLDMRFYNRRRELHRIGALLVD